MTVFVVEDDAVIAEGLAYALGQEGYEVLTAADASCALDMIKKQAVFDFCLLDILLPDGNGFAVCEAVRRSSNVPILFLTACNDEVSTVRALELGADDYIVKPFRIRELLARMKAILRRTAAADAAKTDNAVLYVGGNKVDRQTGRVYRNNEEVMLTAMEYKLLLVLLNNRGRILTRSQILDHLWDEAGDFVNDNTLTVYIKRLRQKLEDSREHPVITTIRGIGYRMEEQGGSAGTQKI